MARKRREPEAHLEEGRGEKPEPEHGERGDQHGGEFGEIAVDLGGVSGDRIGVRRGAVGLPA